MRRVARLIPRGSRREADLFFADLVGEPGPRRASRIDSLIVLPPRNPIALPPVIDRDDGGATESVPGRGRGAFRHEPLGGLAGDNVAARWNVDASTSAGRTIDIVVHLHGYSDQPDDANFLARKTTAAGVDLVADDGTIRIRTNRPTLALVPRARHASGATWLFDRLPNRPAFDALIDAGLSWLATTILGLTAGSTLRRGRLTLAAHSGGGAGMSTLLAAGVNPDELICFDSIYGGDDPIRQWALARLASADAAQSALRVFYTACGDFSWGYRDGRWRLTTTEVSARRLHEAITRALARASGGTALASRFRVERTSVGHSDIPPRYSPLLLDNVEADVPRATAPPPSTSRPACVANDDWLTARPRRPGGEDPPLPRTSESVAIPTEDAYTPPNARAYAPAADASVFRTRPDPIAVTAATQWPHATTTGDAASERALRARGATDAHIRTFGAGGMSAMRPIASVFGDAALTELLQRLRYGPMQLVQPPHSYDNDAELTRAFGRTVVRSSILAIRTLLAIPGHFRELARRAGSEQEAYALENVGWLLMQSLATDVRTATGLDFWLPSSPTFVSPFAAAVAGLSPQVTQLIAARALTDRAIDVTAYQGKFTAWQSGASGRMWRFETGRDTSPGRPAAAPFYGNGFTIPPRVNITAERAQIASAWARRLADVDAGRTTVPLTTCESSYVSRLGLMSRVDLRGLQVRMAFPSPSRAATLTHLTGLAAVHQVFEAAFQAITDLGWNDLVFETEGMGCFRGVKLPGRPEAARRMSEHSLGIAVDLNVFENAQNTTGSMDPRIVALFEAFRFRWGRGFPVPDPMHFEYAG